MNELITEEDVLEAIGKHRVRHVSIETEFVFAGKCKQHPHEIGVDETHRQVIKDHLENLEKEGVIKSSGDTLKTYEVITPESETADR